VWLIKIKKMKLFSTLIFSIFFFTTTLFSQKENPVTNKIIYSFSHIKDTNRTDIVTNEDMILFISEDKSKYQSFTLHILDSINNENLKKTGKLFVSKGTREQIITDFNKNIQYSVIPWLDDTLLIKNDLDTINWILKDSSKSIEGFQCMKAEGFCKGRIYIAWFCPEIAIPAGPWKLSGLPGLILEAYDLKKSINFIFKSLTNVKATEFIDLPNKLTIVTKNEYNRMKESILNNPAGYINSVLNTSGFSNGINLTSKIDIKTSPGENVSRKKINNPLEL